MAESDPSHDEPEEVRSPLAPDPAAAPQWRQGLFVSAVVHLLAIVLLIVVPYQIYQASRGPVAHAPAGGSGSESPPAADPRAAKPKEKTLPDGSPVVPAEQAQAAFERLLRENQKVSPQERERRLVEAAAELQKVTNPDSLKKISSQFDGWFAVAPRAAPKSAPPPPGAENSVQSLNRFDAASAQIHDVRLRRILPSAAAPASSDPPKTEAPAPGGTPLNGEPAAAERKPKPKAKKPPPQYEAVLVDAKGESIVVPLAEEEGESLHRVFRLVKSNPLLEQIYRDMAAPLLDKLLRDAPAPPPTN